MILLVYSLKRDENNTKFKIRSRIKQVGNMKSHKSTELGRMNLEFE